MIDWFGIYDLMR